jgi:ABC-2 type transport system permease protein
MGIATLLKRELMVYLRFWPMSIGGPVLMVILYMAIFSLALGPQRATEAGSRVLPFIAPGLVALAILQRAAETCTFSIMLKKMEGGLSDLLSAPLRAAELAGAHVLAGTLAGLGTGAAVALAVLVWTGTGLAHPLLLLAFAVGAGAMMAAFGLIVGIWAEKWDHVAAVYGFIILPIAFMSGIFAPIDALPAPFDTLVRLNPLYYLIDGLRVAVLGTDFATTPPALGLAVVAAMDAVLIGLAVRLIAIGYKIRS